jgi:RHS repeat-associated protein
MAMDGSGTMAWAHTNVWAGGQLIATYSAVTDSSGQPDGALHFYLNDWLGTRRAQTDYAGVLEQTCSSLPFGDQESCTPLPTEQLFTGKERDTESGNDYFGARYYASTTGRFLSPDPLAGERTNPQSLNRYTYGLNNPLVNTDPTGMYVCDDSWDCTSQNDKNFAKGLAAAQDAANGLKDQYGDDSDEYKNAQRAIDSYGAQGVDNGVDVKFADTSRGDAQTAVSGVAGQKTADNPTGQNIEVTFKADSASSAGLIAHEGSHVADASNWVKSGFSPGQDPTRYGTEIKAYNVQFNILQQQMQSQNSLPVNWLGGTLIPGESWRDFRPTVQNFLQTSPAYGFTYRDTTSAFVKGSQIPQ